MYKKPKLNQKVYVLTHDPKTGLPWGIHKTSVYLKNDCCFATPFICERDMCEELRGVYYFEDFRISWFSSVKAAFDYVDKVIEEKGYKKWRIKKENDYFWDIIIGDWSDEE